MKKLLLLLIIFSALAFSQWIPIVPVSVKWYSADFTYDGGDITITTAEAGYLVTACVVEITETFDGTGLITVGDGSAADGFIDDTDINQGVAAYYGDDDDEHGTYLWDAGGTHAIKYLYKTSEAIKAYVTAGTSTQGTGTAWIKVERLK